MSRLDSFIHRMQAQRDCLDMLAGLIGDVPGPVIELGLGDGRTYDHLRGIFPDRAIFAFDRQNAAHPDSAPDADHMILGDFDRTLPAALRRIGQPAALIHCDFGSSDSSVDALVATAIAPLIVPLLAPGGVVASDQSLPEVGWAPLTLPQTVAPGRYFLWRSA